MFDTKEEPIDSRKELLLNDGAEEPTCESYNSPRSNTHEDGERQLQVATQEADLKRSASVRSRAGLPPPLINNWVTDTPSPSRSFKPVSSQRRAE